MKNYIRRPEEFRTGEHHAAFPDSASANWRLSQGDAAALQMGAIGGANFAPIPGLGATNKARAINSFRASGYRLRLAALQFPGPLDRRNANSATWALHNVGSGPVLEDRPVEWQLRQAGAVVWRQTLPLDLRELLPGAPAEFVSQALTGLADVPPGGYDLCIEGPALAGGRRPALALDANTVRVGGAYVLGSIVVQ